LVFEAWRRIDFTSSSDVGDRLRRISRVYPQNIIDYLPSVDEYYAFSRWAYRFFYNNKGYIHLGVSDWIGYRPGPEALLDFISDHIAKNNVHSVLELGYGMGSNLSYLSGKHPDIMFVGVDRVNLPLDSNRSGENVHYVHADFEDVGRLFPGKFDLIIGIEAICYSSGLKVVDAAADALTSGGTFIVFDIYNHTDRELTEEETRARSACARSVGIDAFIDYVYAIERFSKRFEPISSADLSSNVMGSLERMENIAAFYFRHPFLARIFNRFNHFAFTRNSILGLLLPACLRNGTLCYRMDMMKLR